MWCVSSKQWDPGSLNCHESPLVCVLDRSHNISHQHRNCFVLLCSSSKRCRCYHSPACGGAKNASSVFLRSVVRLLLFGWLITCQSAFRVWLSASGLNGYLAQKSLGPIKALANENTNKNRLMNLHWSVYSLKTSKWSLTGHVLCFQAAAGPEVTSQEHEWPPGSTLHDLIHRMNSSPHPLCLGSSPGSWVDWEQQGTWSASQINIMELIDQLKFSQGTVLECTHSFLLCVTHWGPRLPHSIHRSYLNLSSRVTSDRNDSCLCLFLLPFLCSALLFLLGSKVNQPYVWRQLAPILETNVETFLKLFTVGWKDAAITF